MGRMVYLDRSLVNSFGLDLYRVRLDRRDLLSLGPRTDETGDRRVFR